MSILGAAAIAGGASLLGQGINAYSTGRMNRRSERFAWNMYGQQRQDAMADWNMQNAYNDPSAQMARLQAAGLNPNLVYGSGSAANTTTAPRGANAPTPRFQAPQVDPAGVVHAAMATRQLQANIARTEAETERIQSQTITNEFKNQLNDLIGLDTMAHRYSRATDLLSTQAAKAEADFNAWAAGNFDGKPSNDRNSPLAIAYRARADVALEGIKRAKLTNNAVELDNIVRQFKANLVKEGLSPDSPWYVKTIGALLDRAGLLKDNSQDFDLFQFH